MAGIYIIRKGHEGYIGLDSNAHDNFSGRLIDHASRTYAISGRDIMRGKWQAVAKGDIVNEKNIQRCEQDMSEKTPSYYEYFLNTDSNFGIKDSTYFTTFSKIWSTNSSHAEEEWAEICYIYHYHNNHKWSSLNDIWGGQSSFTCDFFSKLGLKETDINDKSLYRELKKEVKWSARQNKSMQQSHMDKLFYPELIVVDNLKKYCNEKIKKILNKSLIKDCIIKHYQDEDINDILQKQCNILEHDCNLILQRLAENSSVIKKTSTKCIFKINSNGVISFKKILNSISLKNITYKSKISDTFMKENTKSISLISYNIQVGLLSRRKLPAWFPSADQFNINNFTNVTNEIKKALIEYDNAIYKVFEKANGPFNWDYQTTLTYFSSSIPTDIYNGIISKTTFHDYYNDLMNYWFNDKYGPLRKIKENSQAFIAQRPGWATETFVSVPKIYSKSVFQENIAFENIKTW